MKLFVSYVKEHLRLISAGIIFFVIFLTAFELYHLPVAAVIYPTILCLLIGVFIFFLNFIHKKNRHKMLDAIQCITDVQSYMMPSCEGMDDCDYQRIISAICREHNKYKNDADVRYDDMIDYYTVWAHQIKTPIASMRLRLKSEDSQIALKLSADLNRIEQYVDMVLMFLRLDAESTDYIIKEYDLDMIIQRCVKRFAEEFIERRLTLIYEPLNIKVLTDEKWLSFVIEQVLSNALKYTPHGSISITNDGNKLCISDTGIGISPEDLPRIFESSYTGSNGRAYKKASGIGLYLCRRICGNLGHTINASSVVGKGTDIIIDLSHEIIEKE